MIRTSVRSLTGWPSCSSRWTNPVSGSTDCHTGSSSLPSITGFCVTIVAVTARVTDVVAVDVCVTAGLWAPIRAADARIRAIVRKKDDACEPKPRIVADETEGTLMDLLDERLTG